jgi:polyisoprenoid-binding protein YceI
MSDLSALSPGTWTIDPAHSTVGFVARHLMITKVRGRFTDFSGAIEIAPDPLQSSVQATVNLASITTGDEGRDAHLRSADFFDT